MNEVISKFRQDESVEPREAVTEWIEDYPDKVGRN